MDLKMITENIAHVQNNSDAPILDDVQSALDMIATAWHEGNCTRLILSKQDISESFFDLKTKIAGEILQKFVNYGFRIAIVGDFQCYTSTSLKDFIYESNQGRIINFVDSMDAAVASLS